MVKKEEVPNRQYTQEFKLEAVRLAQSIGGNQAAKRMGTPDSSLWTWLRLSHLGRLETGSPKASEVRRPVSELEADVSLDNRLCWADQVIGEEYGCSDRWKPGSKVTVTH